MRSAIATTIPTGANLGTLPPTRKSARKAEHLYSSSSKEPKVGDRAREYGRFEEAEPGNFGGSTHSRDGDWVITKVDFFAQESPDAEYERVIICYCKYVPVEPEWRPIRQGKPVAELLAERELLAHD